jgi:hypothetical protein
MSWTKGSQKYAYIGSYHENQSLYFQDDTWIESWVRERGGITWLLLTIIFQNAWWWFAIYGASDLIRRDALLNPRQRKRFKEHFLIIWQ